MNGIAWTPDEDKRLLALIGGGMTIKDASKAIGRSSTSGFSRLRLLKTNRAAKVVEAILTPPPPIDWQAVRAEQAAKPASDRWPYTMPALVERVWQSRAPTWVASASSIA